MARRKRTASGDYERTSLDLGDEDEERSGEDEEKVMVMNERKGWWSSLSWVTPKKERRRGEEARKWRVVLGEKEGGGAVGLKSSRHMEMRWRLEGRRRR